MDHLEKNGCESRCLPTKTVDRQRLCLRPHSTESLWYSLGPDVLREYLLCLSRSSGLFSLGVAAIPHYATRAVYCEVLKGENPPPQPQLALDGDVDGEGACPTQATQASTSPRPGPPPPPRQVGISSASGRCTGCEAGGFAFRICRKQRLPQKCCWQRGSVCSRRQPHSQLRLGQWRREARGGPRRDHGP